MNILICDSDAEIRRATRECLESLRHEVTECCDAAAALEAVRSGSFELVLQEMRATDARCAAFLGKILAVSPGLHVVIHSSQATVKAAVEAVRHGAFDIVLRPVPREDLAALLQRSALARMPPSEPADSEAFVHSFAPEVCLGSQSRHVREAIASAASAAPANAAVLLRGERGTGKSVLARAIHAASKRADQPFVSVLAAERSAQTYESELFGHVQGAFAGATRNSPGRVVNAQHGTLYFHEIAEIPVALQPKLLRLVEEKCYEPLGDHCERTSDVRIIAATRHDLESAVVVGRFREELYRALNVIEIVLPSLRQRQADILPLADHLLRHFAKLHGKALSEFTHIAQQALSAYSWPGNVGELRQAVERGVLLSSGALVDVAHLPAAVARCEKPAQQAINIMPLRVVEADCIRHALAWSDSIEEASERLGINASTLYRKRKRYGI